MPDISFNIVVFPAPFSPTIATPSFLSTLKSAPFRAHNSSVLGLPSIIYLIKYFSHTSLNCRAVFSSVIAYILFTTVFSSLTNKRYPAVKNAEDAAKTHKKYGHIKTLLS